MPASCTTPCTDGMVVRTRTEQVQRLTDLAGGNAYVLLSPFDGLPEQPIVASAWGLQLPLETADDPRLEQFLVKYQQGEQTPEPGAPCTGGVSP